MWLEQRGDAVGRAGGGERTDRVVRLGRLKGRRCGRRRRHSSSHVGISAWGDGAAHVAGARGAGRDDHCCGREAAFKYF